LGGYDVERVEALLRERAHSLTRTPRTTTTALLDVTPEFPPPVRDPDGDRGCVACDNPIGVARLRVVPSAVRCIDCQLAFEERLAPQPARA
jgi:Prokaryotic dksA/traR C4-type zinc finger